MLLVGLYLLVLLESVAPLDLVRRLRDVTAGHATPLPPPHEKRHLTASEQASRARHAASCWAAGSWVLLPPSKPSVAADWTWEVPPRKGCPSYAPFNRSHFCSIMRGRSLFVAGDSMNVDFHDLLQHLASNGTGPHEFRNIGPDRPQWQPIICEDYTPVKTPRIRVYRLAGAAKDSGRDEWPLESWVSNSSLLAEHGFSRPPAILVINRGMHFSLSHYFVPSMNRTLAWATKALPDTLLIWRNTPVGHPNCMSHTAPLVTPLPRSAYITDPTAREYHWLDVHDQNDNVTALLNAHYPSVIPWDMDTSTSLRPDQHWKATDCVHLVESGQTLANWVRSFYNLMRVLESAE